MKTPDGPYRLEADLDGCVHLTHADVPNLCLQIRTPATYADELVLKRLVWLLNLYDGTPGNALAAAVAAKETR